MRRTRNLLILALALVTTFAMGQMYPGQSGSQPGMGQGRPGTPPTVPSHAGDENQTPGQTTSDTDKDRHDRKGAKVDDDTLQRQVHEQLATRTEFSNVQVSVKNGVVNLQGSVPRKEDRKEAKNLVESIPGVRSVKEKLSVNANAGAAASSTTGGMTGAAGAAGTSSGTSSVSPSTTPMSGSASGETATATGSSSTQSSANVGAATGTTGGVAGTTTSGQNAGVSGSGNTGAIGSSAQQGTAGTSGTATETGNTGAAATTGNTGSAATAGSMNAGSSDASTLQGQLQTALQREPTLASDNVNVNVTDSEIVLSGSVATGKEKQTARRIAQSYAGNRRVVDHLTVTGRGHGANMNKGTGSSGAIGSQPSSSTGMGSSTETGTQNPPAGQNPPDQTNPRPDQTNNPR